MSKNQTVIKSYHAFSLVALKEDCHYKSTLADFTPPPNPSKASNSIMPGFLNDQNYFTPAFVPMRQKDYYETTTSVEKMRFDTRIQKAQQLWKGIQEHEEDSLKLSPATPSTNYCQICKIGFTQYSDHLRDAGHLRQARFSKANTYASQLCKMYSKNKSKAGKDSKIKPIAKAQRQNGVHKRRSNRTSKKFNNQTESSPGVKQQNLSTNMASAIPAIDC